MAGKHHQVKVTIDIMRLAQRLAGYTVTVQALSEYLGTSNRTAGKVLARMEKLGLARRLSRRAYAIHYN